ncbi:MAG: hypothetical protein IPO07_01450 [Haliscomenobacter sp.]|nr:hypothetical protein [Haliscomenobacter sp.]MBK9487580.1 hypothetical protein [Haliscomenobacter sp.]
MKQEEAWKDTEKDQHKALKSISPYRIVIPALLGLAGVFCMLWRNFDPEEFQRIQWTGHVYFDWDGDYHRVDSICLTLSVCGR